MESSLELTARLRRLHPEVAVPEAGPAWWMRLQFRVVDLVIGPLFALACAVIGRFPRKKSMALAGWIATRATRLIGLTNFRRNLRVVLGESVAPGNPQVDDLVARSATHQLCTILDIVQVLDRKQVPLENLVEVHGEEHLAAASRLGRGGLVITAHVGNWELAAAWIACRGWPMNALYFEQRSRVLDSYLGRVREACGVRMHHQRRGLRGAIEALRRNEWVGLAIDQDGTRNGLFMDFFGHLVSVPRGAAQLALKYRVPVVHLWNQRLEDGRYRLVFEEPWVAPEGAQTDEDSQRDLARRWLEGFERVIRKDPAQWLISYDRFKLRHVTRLCELGLAERAFAEQEWIRKGFD